MRTTPNKNTIIWVKNEIGEDVVLKLKKIKLVKATHNGISLLSKKGNIYFMYITLDQFMLDFECVHLFCMVHRSSIVGVRFIKRHHFAHHYLILKGNVKVDMSALGVDNYLKGFPPYQFTKCA